MLLFSCPVVSNSLQPHGLQHTRSLCPSPSPSDCPSSCPLNWWCHPTISSSVIPVSSCPQSFPTAGSFSMSWLFHQVAKVLKLQLQLQSFQWVFRVDFLIDGFDLLDVSGTLKSLLQHHSLKTSFLRCSVFLRVLLSHPYIPINNICSVITDWQVSDVSEREGVVPTGGLPGGRRS